MVSSIKKTIVEELDQVKRTEEEALAQSRAAQLGTQYLNLDTFPIIISDLMLLPESQARETKSAVVKRDGSIVVLAALHPDAPAILTLIGQFEAQGYTVRPTAVSLSSLKLAWEKYKLYKELGEEIRKTFIIKQERVDELKARLKGRSEVERELLQIKEEDTSSFLEVLFTGATQANSNDIHIEPEEHSAKVRFRIDGILQDITTIAPGLFQYVLNRLKILAELKLNQKGTPQDGRFTIRQKGLNGDNDIDVRISLIPSYFGETIVMRLLGVAVTNLDIDTLGMYDHQKELLLANLSLPNGMILTTGPTGSGKTTLLYAALNRIKKPEINIITIENPIEYQIEGITQTQVDSNKNYTFEKGLQSILRQDPDVVLVGEIRSQETADIAVNAALTGHLVLSTLHTNDAPGSIERLLNLKVKVHLIPAAVRLVIAQRLVRTLCQHCKQEVPLPQENREAIKEAISLISPRAMVNIPQIPSVMYTPKGCEQCFGTGYKGRTGVFELFELNDVMEEKILAGVTQYELRKVAIEYGMLTLLQHAILKMLDGLTSLEEVQRVAGDAKYIEELYGQAVLSVLSKTLSISNDTLEKLVALPANTPEEVSKLFASMDDDQLREAVISFASRVNASDIHIEPKEKDFEIKYRIDGILHTFAQLRSERYAYLLSTIKELAGMKIGTYKHIQEGRFSVIVHDQVLRIDIRVSLIPGGYGEAAVLRILPNEFTFSLEKLGMPEQLRGRLAQEVKQPNGLILATGPTGAGKTTTLYAILQLIVHDKKKIITIENPIEYKIPDILQTQVSPDEGYDFPDAMRAILRQDPDVLLIGEIRDTLTARTVFQAASTGHLVFSTLHTNDALGVLERLYSLEMPAEQVASILNVVMAQRLVRKLCDHCKKSVSPSPEVRQALQHHIEAISAYLRPATIDWAGVQLYEGVGCKECTFTGFNGRIGIFEVIFMSDAMKGLIRGHAQPPELIAQARNDGSMFLAEDAALKLIDGATALTEVERVLGSL